MPVVSLVNRKGGVGKTTLTLALADFLSFTYQKRVLLIDLDSQANLSVACLGELRWREIDRRAMSVADTFADVVAGRSPRLHTDQVARVKNGLPISILASTPRLQDIEEEAMEGNPAWRMRFGSPYQVLHQALRQNLPMYDFVLIDCPPALRFACLNGIAISNGYLIPVMPSPISIAGLKQVVVKLDQFAKELKIPLKRYGTIVNRYMPSTTLHSGVLRELRGEPMYAPVWNTLIANTVGMERGAGSEAPKTLVQRWGPACADLAAFAEEFVRRVY